MQIFDLQTFEAFQHEFEGRPVATKMLEAMERIEKHEQLAREHQQKAKQYQEFFNELRIRWEKACAGDK